MLVVAVVPTRKLADHKIDTPNICGRPLSMGLMGGWLCIFTSHLNCRSRTPLWYLKPYPYQPS